MIPFFPSPYPDELLYSLLSRYYAKSGYMGYTYAAEGLFTSKTVRPDIAFVNAYTPDALHAITQYMPMEEVIERHTMFPYYGRFLPLDRRRRAHQALVGMEGNYHNLLPIPQNRSKEKKDRCLRYCPLCAAEDRTEHGETYWHRTHQMIGLPVCPVHSCRLMDAPVINSGKAPPSLKPAEAVIPHTEQSVTYGNEIEHRLSEYMATVFQACVDLDSNVSIGQFLYSKMQGTEYTSRRGQQRNMTLFYKNYIDFYRDLPDNPITELWQLQKVLTNDRLNFTEICLVALFLNVPPDELTRLTLPEKSQQELFDEEVHRLHKQGLKYPAIAERLNASVNVVKSIGERHYGTYHRPSKAQNRKSGVAARDWSKIDQDTLPLVRVAIRQLQGDGTTRPKKVTPFAVEKQLHLTSKCLTLNLPKCFAEVEKHKESQPQYWAREVCWAVRRLENTGTPLTWRKVRDLTNIRRRDYDACLPYISDYADRETVERIKAMI